MTNAVLEIGALACVLAKVIGGSPGQRKLCQGLAKFDVLFNWLSLFFFVSLNQSTRRYFEVVRPVTTDLEKVSVLPSLSSGEPGAPRQQGLDPHVHPPQGLQREESDDSTPSHLQWEAAERVACLT